MERLDALRYDVASINQRTQSNASMTTNNTHLVDDLSQRVRELTLLHEVTRILRREDVVSPSDWLEEIVQAIPRAWPHPGAVTVRARLGTFDVATCGPPRPPEPLPG